MTTLRQSARHKALLFGPAGQFLTAENEWTPEKNDRIAAGMAREDFDVRELPSARSSWFRFAGDDDRRLADTIAALTDAKADVSIALRGGSGTQRLLARLPWDGLRRVQTAVPILSGFSDVTLLLNALWVHTGRVSLHGLMGGDFDPVRGVLKEDFDAFHRAVAAFGREDAPWSYAFQPERLWRAGEGAALTDARMLDDLLSGNSAATLRLWGGNLTMLTTLAGTPDSPVAKLREEENAVFLEDVGEPAWRIDRALRHLSVAGFFDRTRLMLLGDFSGADRITAHQGGFTFEEAVRGFSADHPDLTILSGLPLGHGPRRATMPVGARIDFSCEFAWQCDGRVPSDGVWLTLAKAVPSSTR